MARRSAALITLDWLMSEISRGTARVVRGVEVCLGRPTAVGLPVGGR